MTALLAIIYATFISLGLPDAVVGAAWPSMYTELGADKAAASLVSMTVVASTITASFASSWLLRRFGTFKVAATSILLTALALFGYALVPNFPVLLLLAIPLGLGGGAIDTALNSFVAVNFSSTHMNFLHASWGIGASAGPLIVSVWLGTIGQWRPAYVTIAAMQCALFAVFLASRRLWPAEAAYDSSSSSTPQPKDPVDNSPSSKAPLPTGADLTDLPWYRMPNLGIILVGFFGYSAIEMTLGLWGATYFVERFDLTADLAAAGASAYYIGITVGRVVAGIAARRISNHGLLGIGSGLLLAGVVILLLPVPQVSLFGFALAGFGGGPVFPMMLQETTRRFGSLNTTRMMGIQMGLSYSGMLAVPPIAGVILTRVSPLTLPLVAIVLAIGVAASVQIVERRVRLRK